MSKKNISILKNSLILVIFLFTIFQSFSAEQSCDFCEGCFTSCTTIIAGKDATVDGSTMTSHTADCGRCDSRLIYVPAQDHEPGSMRAVYPFILPYPRYVGDDRGPGYAAKEGQTPTEALGYIPEVEHTYAYFDAVYGVMNEFQVGIGECTDRSITDRIGQPPPEGDALFDIAAASRVAMERCKTAREAIQLIGDLCVEYGYYGRAETLTIIDPEEAWLLEVLNTPDGKSAIWVAQRVPDDEVAVASNLLVIREIDLDNPDYFMASDNIFEVSKEEGWWNPEKGEFDFAGIYSEGRDHPYYSLRRKWRAYDLLAPSQGFSPWVEGYDTKAYPFSVKPDEKLSVEGLFTILRDYYEGTEFDLTQGLAAGPFGTPNRYAGGGAERLLEGNWERPISIFRADYTSVLQARNWLPDPVGGVLWWIPDVAFSGCFVPFYCGITELPEAYSTGNRHAFDKDSAFWVFNFIGNWADLKFSYMIEDIREKQQEYEGKMLAMQPGIDQAAKAMYEQDPDLARQFLTDYCNSNANKVVKEWWDFAEFLIMKYIDGYINVPDVGQSVGYPLWWLKEVGFEDGPYKTYEKPEHMK
jgi:dipeptidase